MPIIITNHMTNIDIQSVNPQGAIIGIARDNPVLLFRPDMSSISPDKSNRYIHDTQVIIMIATTIITLSRLYADREPPFGPSPIIAC
jgi:hypothetical protein